MERLNRRYLIHYASIQAMYWFTYCAGLGFLSVLLLDCGYTNARIGILMAISNIIAVVLQPMVAAYADRTTRVELKTIVTIVTIISAGVATALTFCRQESIIMSVLMVSLMCLVVMVQPLVNSLSVAYERDGIRMNFGVARSCGSLTYAAVSIIIGVLLKWFPTYILPGTAAIFLVVMAYIVYSYKKPKQPVQAATTEQQDGERHTTESEKVCDNQSAEPLFEVKQRPKTLVEFIKTNKRLMIFLFSMMLIYYNHMLLSSFTMQIIDYTGGDNTNMGVATAIAAAVEFPAMFLFDKLRRRINCANLLRFAAVGFLIKNIIIVMANSVAMVYLAQSMQCISFALFMPAGVYYINKISGNADAVKGQALYSSFGTMASIFASIIGGQILDIYDAHFMVQTGLVATTIGVVILFFSVQRVKE